MLSKPTPPSDQSRRGVDRGSANDNFDFWDPVATPLGGDDEAAGQSPFAAERAPAKRALAFRNEPDPDEVPDSGSLSERYLPFRLILLLAVAFLVVLAVSWWLWGQ